MGEAKSPSFSTIFSIVVKVFLAIILLVVILIVIFMYLGSSTKESSRLCADDECRQVLANCEAKWPNNYDAKASCLKKQKKAMEELVTLLRKIKRKYSGTTLGIATADCGERWKEGEVWNYDMMLRCVKNEARAHGVTY